MNKAEMLVQIRRGLNDPTGTVWKAADLKEIIDNVIDEIEVRDPLLKRTNLALVDYTTDVSLSPLTMLGLENVEYPVVSHWNPDLHGQGYSRGYKEYGDTLISLTLDEPPDITSGTLTGTVTFTISSRTVSGAGTLFTSELTGGAEGDLICKSTGSKWYQIAKVVSATSLVLYEPFEEASGADTISVTKYRDYQSCARIHYKGSYTVSDTATDMPRRLDPVAILGTVAHAAVEYASGYVKDKLVLVTTTLATALTTIGNASARLTQAATDLTTTRTDIEANLGSFVSGLGEVETALDQVVTDLVSARAVVNTVNVGGDVATKDVEIAKTNVEEAKTRIEKARSYLESSKTSKDYVDYCSREIDSAAQYINQAGGYIGYVTQSINVAGLVNSYKRWADTRWQEYQSALKSLGVAGKRMSAPLLTEL